MGHGHSHRAGEELDAEISVAMKPRLALLSGLVMAAIATVIGLLVLWPSGDPVAELTEKQGSVVAFAAPGVTFPSGDVVDVTEPCPGGVPDGSGCNMLRVDLPEDGEVEVPVARDVLESGLAPGDTVEVMRIPTSEGAPPSYSYFATDRDGTLIWLFALFVAAVLLIARWRGFFALIGLAFGGIVVWTFILPALFDGAPGVGVALAGASAIMFVVLYTTHGFSLRTSTALAGTLLGILVTSLIGVFAINQARLTGVTDDTGARLGAFTDLSFQSLLGCALVIVGLGVLNDVTITQASAVWELRASAPAAGRGEIFSRGMRIGRDHIASTIYTIVFAYVGTALLMLMLLQIYAQPLLGLLSTEQLAEQIVLTLSTAIGLVLAVPLTTGIAALVAAPQPGARSLHAE